MRCLVVDCGVDMAGKMIVCSPHWQYLSRELRAEIVNVHAQLSAQRRSGNVRRATREAWRELRQRVVEELAVARAELERILGDHVPADGLAWRRATRKIEGRAAALVLPTVEDITPDEAAGERLMVGDEMLPLGTIGQRPGA